MKKIFSLMMSLVMVFILVIIPYKEINKASADEPEMRAAWVSTVFNIDWPSDSSKGSAQIQKQQYIQLIDKLKSVGINTVMVQVRPESDAFYRSKINPWSRYLTGIQGKDPGYDPLAFIIDQSHKRNIAVHAWFNPYRASIYNDKSSTSSNNMMNIHPEWVKKYKNKWYYDPGIPQVTQYIVDTVAEVVSNYNVDGVHFDDYFYPAADFPDQDTFSKYGSGNKDNWRRNNINNMVKKVRDTVHSIKPSVQFGISPAGIWRNKENDPNGSNTNGGESYIKQYADTRYWIKNGLVDYVVPQVYWRIGHPKADYATLIRWWSDQVKGTKVKLYIGEGIYKHGQPEYAGENVAREIKQQLLLNRKYKEIKGAVFFSAKDIVNIPQVYNDLKSLYVGSSGNTGNVVNEGNSTNESTSNKNYRAPYKNSLMGKDRTETAIAISKRGWSNGSNTCVLVNGEDMVSGVISSPLAASYNAPILLSFKNKVSTSTINEMKRLNIKNLVVVGKTNSISNKDIKNIEDAIPGLNTNIIYSSNIQDESTKIADHLLEKKQADTVYIASEDALADVLSIASLASNQKSPILIVSKDKISTNNIGWINTHGIKNINIIGGPKTISNALIDNLKSNTSANINRIYGSNRIETNTKVIESLYPSKFFKKAFITNSNALIDAITVSAFAQKTNSPVILAGSRVTNYQTKILEPKSASLVYKVGGKVSNSSFESIYNLLSGLMEDN